MARPIRTFDVFDTLIARRCVEPQFVLEKLERKAGLPGLKAARLKADQSLWSQGKPYLLSDIWLEVERSLGLDRSTTSRLLESEIDLELDEVIPIVENMALVRDGDLLVSDTYLPAEIVRSLLRRVGLDRRVGLVTSNDGKFRGWIWKQLPEQFSIELHLGDNPESDLKSAAKAGITGAVTSATSRTSIERSLIDHGWTQLANLVREVRLANPFTDTDPHRRHLWLLGCQLNFPLLFFASQLLEAYASTNGIREILFVSRDCMMWHELYRELLPHRRSTYLYTSRKCLFHPTPSYVQYFRSVWGHETLIVDLTSTGISWSKFLSKLGLKSRFFLIGRIDDCAYMKESLVADDWMEITAVFRNSELTKPPNKAVEMLNYTPHGIVEDVVLLPGQAPLPVLAEEFEFDRRLPETVHESFKTCIRKMEHYPDLKRSQTASAADLVKTFVSLICNDPHLGRIYSGHQSRDEAYMQRILAMS